MQLDIFIPGTPKPAGSKRAFLIRHKDGSPVMKNGRAIINTVDTSGKKGKDWRGDIQAAVLKATEMAPLRTESLTVWMIFYMPRPKSHFRTGKYAGILKDSAPLFYNHLQAPDALKLGRAAEDALSGVLWVDDKQVRGWYEKRWSDDGRIGLNLKVQSTSELIAEKQP
jgi:hypothetical protein